MVCDANPALRFHNSGSTKIAFFQVRQGIEFTATSDGGTVNNSERFN